MEPSTAFTELSQLVVGSTPVGQVLTRVAALAAACVPGAKEVSVTLLEANGKARTPAFSGDLAAHLDEKQYEIGFGPCLNAAATGNTIRVDDTTTSSAYPDFCAIAARQGVRSIVSVGMPPPQRIQGGINVFRFDEPLLDDDSVQLLQAFAAYAATALANHLLYASSVALTSQLEMAFQSRMVIEQAKGVLMTRLHCSAGDAFQHLVSTAGENWPPVDG